MMKAYHWYKFDMFKDIWKVNRKRRKEAKIKGQEKNKLNKMILKRQKKKSLGCTNGKWMSENSEGRNGSSDEKGCGLNKCFWT